MACPGCLRRGLLLRELAANIDRSVHRAPGGRAREILALDDRDLAVALTPGVEQAERVLEASAAQARSCRFGEQLDRAGCWAICRHERGWPGAFERLGEAAPRALYGRGDRALLLVAEGSPAVTIVGARRASSYGRETAQSLAADLAAAGLPVISGMAFGIDAAAHRGALVGGRTLAVLGAGAERAYPRSSSRLFDQIGETGAVVSELPPDTPTFRWTFPARNRLMAALAEMTVVVEAAERSGSLITAEMAIESGRLVGAVPGPVNSWRSSGTNKLLRDGACVIRDAADVLDHLLGPGAHSSAAPVTLGLEQACVLDLIEAGARTIDEFAERSGLGFAAVAAALAGLELGGHVVSVADGGYVRGATSVNTMPP
jgi:DNA processing protein